MESVPLTLPKLSHRYSETKDSYTRRVIVLDPHDETSLEILGKDSYVGTYFHDYNIHKNILQAIQQQRETVHEVGTEVSDLVIVKR